MPAEILTDRLRLRAWRDDDLAPFAAMSADPQVMRYYPATLRREESNALAQRIREHFDAHGFGLWAVEIPGVSTFAGFIGLSVPHFQEHFTPCVEIGWRLAAQHWGCGYATEGARVVLAHAFGDLGLQEVVSFTTATNWPSRRVMERIGMTHDPADDFEHPGLEPGHPQRRHVLYRAVPRKEK